MTTTVDPTVTLMQLARETAKAIPDTDNAARTLLRRVREQGLADPLLAHMTYTAAKSEIERMKHAVRSGFIAKASRRGEESTAAYTVAIGLLDGWHIGGLRLKDCKRVDLEEAAREQRATARGNIVRAAFYEALAAKLKKDQSVGQAFDDDAASKLLASVEAAT
jgi:hypothetical protein